MTGQYKITWQDRDASIGQEHYTDYYDSLERVRELVETGVPIKYIHMKLGRKEFKLHVNVGVKD